MKSIKQNLIRKVKKYSLFILIIFLLTGIIACGSKQTGAVTAKSFIAEHFFIENIQYIHSAVSHGNIVYFSGFEGSADFEEGYAIADSDVIQYLYFIDLDLEEPKAMRIPFPLKSNSFISSISISPDDIINLAILNYVGDYENGMKPEIIVKQINRDGTEISSTVLFNDIHDTYIFPQDLIIDDKGRIYLININVIYIWNQSGSLISKIPIDGNNLKMARNRTYEENYVVWNNDAGEAKMAVINSDSGTLGQNFNISTANYTRIVPGIYSDLLFSSVNGVYTYDVNKRSFEKVFEWGNIGMKTDFGGMLLPLYDGRIGWLENKHPEGGVDFRIVRPLREGEELAEKETLVIGGVLIFIDDALRTAIIEFNHSHPKYWIEIKEYATEDSSDDEFNEGVTRLNLDIVNGKGPDIIVLPPRISMELYARKGVLADLYPFINEDKNMKRADFQENIIKAHELDGRLLGMPIFYQIHTLVAAESEIGDIKGWNLDEMIEYVNSRLPDSKVFADYSKSGVLSLCLRANGEALVDWNNVDNGFQRDLYLKMLYFANQFTPDHLYVYDDNIAGRIQDDKQVQLWSKVLIGYYYHQNLSEIFGELVVYPGFPSENGNGNLINSYSVISINQNSEHKNAAWEFISSMLTEEFQTRNFTTSLISFPILKSAHEAKIKEAMRGFYDWAENSHVAGATESDIQTVTDLINSAEKIRVYDEHILNIAMEEAGYFFSGIKTAEEVADIAENRIAIYVSEMN
ncbi:MAG: extracellular solute-binding protein [Lachnospiraceae bacterium]|nr:extracellular solute-binding protein [Lachnospiraceae bacterium]